MGRLGSSGGDSYLTGLRQVEANLNLALEDIQISGIRGLVLAAALIRHQTEHKSPKTPRKYGNLIASWLVVTAETTHVGKGTARFTGPDAAVLISEHQEAIAQFQAEVKALTKKTKKFVIFGYSANYAGFIHEMIGADASNFTRKGSNIKWFETHLKANSNVILKLIGTNIKK
jgi:hypothetical protein